MFAGLGVGITELFCHEFLCELHRWIWKICQFAPFYDMSLEVELGQISEGYTYALVSLVTAFRSVSKRLGRKDRDSEGTIMGLIGY